MVTLTILRTYSIFWNLFKFATYVDLNKCLKQIKLPISLRTCAPITELPSGKSTMTSALNFRKKKLIPIEKLTFFAEYRFVAFSIHWDQGSINLSLKTGSGSYQQTRIRFLNKVGSGCGVFDRIRIRFFKLDPDPVFKIKDGSGSGSFSQIRIRL